MLVIDDLLIGMPVKSLIFIMKKIRDLVDEELNNEEKKRLLMLDDELRNDLINSDDYLQKEMEILNQARKKKNA